MSRPAMCHFEFQMSWRHQEGWMCPPMSQVSCYNTSCSWRPSKHLCNGFVFFWLGVNSRLLKLIQAAAPDTNVAGRWEWEMWDLVIWLDWAVLRDGWLSYQQHDDFCDMLPSCIVYIPWDSEEYSCISICGVLLVDWTIQLRNVGDRIKKATEKVGPSVL